jgi:hypothetical protein
MHIHRHRHRHTPRVFPRLANADTPHCLMAAFAILTRALFSYLYTYIHTYIYIYIRQF